MSRDSLKKYNIHILKQIINRLIGATKSGYCEWKHTGSSSFRQKSKGTSTWYMSYESDDGETTYKTGIELGDDGTFQSTFSHLWINNDKLGYDEIFAGYQLDMEKEIMGLMKLIYND